MLIKPWSPKATWTIRAKPELNSQCAASTTSPVVAQGHVVRHANLCRPQLSPEQITRFRRVRQDRPLWPLRQLPRHPALFPKSQLCKPRARQIDFRVHYGRCLHGCTILSIQNAEPTGKRPPPESCRSRIYLGATRLVHRCGFNPGCTLTSDLQTAV